jgi:hypothetical protein
MKYRYSAGRYDGPVAIAHHLKESSKLAVEILLAQEARLLDRPSMLSRRWRYQMPNRMKMHID